MSTPQSSEKRLQYLADDILNFLISYFVTFWMILRNPRTRLPQLLSSDDRPKDGMLPGAFLVATILLVFAIRTMFGFSLPDFQVELPWIANFPITFLRYLLGSLVLSIFLLLFVSRQNFPNGLVQIAPVVCYASAVYLPLSFVGMWTNRSFGRFIFSVISSVIDRHLSPIFWINSFELLVVLIFYLVGVTWWLYLLNIGMRSVRFNPPLIVRWKKILSAFVSYIITKSVLTFLASIVLYSGTFMTEIRWVLLRMEISESTPRCGKVLTLAQRIAANDDFEVYPRYVAHIVAASCYTITFLPDQLETEEIKQVFTALRESDYERVRGILEEYINEFVEGEVSGSRGLHFLVTSHLRAADKLRQSPAFIELDEDRQLFFTAPTAPIALFP